MFFHAKEWKLVMNASLHTKMNLLNGIVGPRETEGYNYMDWWIEEGSYVKEIFVGGNENGISTKYPRLRGVGSEFFLRQWGSSSKWNH